jgi:two-component system response regulator FlrC
MLRGPAMPVAADPESLALLALAERVAASDITVLINGPTGTGKEVLAKAIHMGSSRRDGPFVAINCAALPETMLEAMLFGHQKGSFTGASSGGQGFLPRREWRHPAARRNRRDAYPAPGQAARAHCRSVRSCRSAGPCRRRSTSASSPAPIAICRAKCSPAASAPISITASRSSRSTKALAERPGDIPALAAAMVLRHAGAREALPWISTDALEILTDHDWPGNVRELENVIQRALLLAPGDTIEAST